MSTPRIAHILPASAQPSHPGGYHFTTDLLHKLLTNAGLNPTTSFVRYLDDRIAEDLADYQPNVIVLWEDKRGTLLRAFGIHKRSLDDWAGYVWPAEALAPGTKVIATYAPERIKLDWGLTGVVKFHLQRAVREAATRELVVPKRTILWQQSVGWFKSMLEDIQSDKCPVAIDIEGGCGMGPACVGFAMNATEAFVVPFYDVDGCSLWTEEEEIELWTALQAVLEDPLVPKIIQNAAYELFVLAWSMGIVVQGLADDTMCKQFELLAELEKSLEFQATLYTTQPNWKLEHRLVEGRYVPFRNGRRATSEEWYVYNGTDCCVTYECNAAMDRQLKPRQREHYQFNVSLLTPLAYMSLRGIAYDKDAAQARLEETQLAIYEKQDQINQEAARSPDRAELRSFFDALGVGREDNPPGPGTPGSHIRDDPEARDTSVVDPSCSLQGEQCSPSPGGASLSVAQHDGLDVLRVERDTVGALLPLLTDTTYPNPTGAIPVQADSGGDTEARNAQGVAGLIPLLTTAFCCCARDRTEAREVEEVSYDPHHFNGRRWVKKGKRTKTPIEDWPTWDEAPDPIEYRVWAKPIRKTVTRNIPVAITTLEDVRRFCLVSRQAACRRALAILRASEHENTRLTAAQRGELATLLGIHIKVNATNAGGDSQWYLYKHLGLPPQYQREGNKPTTRLASDDEAIIKAWVQSGKTPEKRNALALPFLAMRRLVTQTKFLCATPDPDGRIRSAINLVATPTCRMAMYGSPTGTSDLNLQTIGKGLRDLFVADEGCWLGQRDLDNSDAYSVASYCSMLGDPTMLLDAKAKLKPAKILALLYEQGPAINQLDRDQLRVECAKVDGDGWLYFACKRVLHGSNYGMGKVTMANQILTDSYKLLGEPVHLEAAACERIQKQSFFIRYPGVLRWHEWMKREIATKGELITSTGFTRRIFSRKDSHDTLKEALAHFPQYYTTYAIKLALLRQWLDPENRREDGSLIVEPLLVVHDSKLIQFRKEDVEFAKRKDAEWFSNPIHIANEVITIPASGTYGPNWKEQPYKL